MRPSPWLRCVRPNPHATIRLLCLPHAGGAASAYAMWPRAMPRHIEVWAAQLPGRENRLSESTQVDWASLICKLAEAVGSIADGPLLCFGHSMGALMAFELARYLRHHTAFAFQGLLLSGHRAAHLAPNSVPIHHLPDDAFIQKVAEFEGLPMTLVNSADFREIWLPSLRADFTLCERYRYVIDAPLNCPIVALGGVQDGHVRPSDLRAWAMHTHSAFRMHMLPGGHFYLHEQRERFMQTLLLELAALAHAPVAVGQRI